MQVHVKRFGAILVALVFVCSCLSSRHAVAYSPARYQLQQQEPHRARTQMFTPPTALVAPSASVPAAQEAQQRLHIAGDAVLHHVPASHVENAHLHEAIPSMSTDSTDSEVDKVAEAAVTGATIAGAAAIAGAAVGSAAATAGAAAATRAAAASGVDPYVDAVDDWEDLADVLHLLNLESEHAEDHTLPGSDHGVAENITTFPPGGHGNPEYHIVPESKHSMGENNVSHSQGEDAHAKNRVAPESNDSVGGNNLFHSQEEGVHARSHAMPDSNHSVGEDNPSHPHEEGVHARNHAVPGSEHTVGENNLFHSQEEGVHGRNYGVSDSNHSVGEDNPSHPHEEGVHARNHAVPGSNRSIGVNNPSHAQGEGVHARNHTVAESTSSGEHLHSPSSASQRKTNAGVSLPQSSDVASSANVSPSYASLLTRSVQRGSDEGVMASLHPSLTRRMLPGKGVTISRSPALRHVLRTAFISGKALEPFVFKEPTKKDDSNGRAGSADSPTVSASKTPESASSELPSTSATSNAMWRKPESAAWLCRISEPYKGCNTRLYYPGMKDRVSDGDASAGKFYNGATCPEGFCCSKTACSSVGCGDTCSDSSVLCLFQHVEKSYGRGCSCADQPAPRCHPLATCHESLVPGGGVWCECPEGYKGNGLVCCKVGSTGAGCDDTVRRPGVQPASRGNGSNLTVQWTTVWLSVATWALFGHL